MGGQNGRFGRHARILVGEGHSHVTGHAPIPFLNMEEVVVMDCILKLKIATQTRVKVKIEFLCLLDTPSCDLSVIL